MQNRQILWEPRGVKLLDLVERNFLDPPGVREPLLDLFLPGFLVPPGVLDPDRDFFLVPPGVLEPEELPLLPLL